MNCPMVLTDWDCYSMNSNTKITGRLKLQREEGRIEVQIIQLTPLEAFGERVLRPFFGWMKASDLSLYLSKSVVNLSEKVKNSLEVEEASGCLGKCLSGIRKYIGRMSVGALFCCSRHKKEVRQMRKYISNRSAQVRACFRNYKEQGKTASKTKKPEMPIKHVSKKESVQLTANINSKLENYG